MTINRNKDIDYMVSLCFNFQKQFFKTMEKQGFHIIDVDKFYFIEKKLTDNEVPMLNNKEAKMFAELVDITNTSILEADPPYTKNEMRFFRASQNFMENYKKWLLKKT